MKRKHNLTVIAITGLTLLLLLAILSAPVSALTINGISIYLQQNGDATINADYDLSIPEYIAVQTNLFGAREKISQKATEVTGKEISVISIDGKSIAAHVKGMSPAAPEMKTPEIFLRGYKAKEVLIQYPDAHQERFGTTGTIPATSHYMLG